MGKPYWDLEKRLQSAKNLWTLKKKEVLVRKETSGEPFKSQCKQVRLDAFDHLSLPTNWAVEVGKQAVSMGSISVTIDIIIIKLLLLLLLLFQPFRSEYIWKCFSSYLA